MKKKMWIVINGAASVGISDLLARGQVFSDGKRLYQIDEHSEDETITGNQSDTPSNAIILADFRLSQDCESVAVLVNKAVRHRPNIAGEPRRKTRFMKSKRLKRKETTLPGVGSSGFVRALRRALRDIRGQLDPHIGERGEDVTQDPECFCPRCIAVRALCLRPNE